jgi:hypothetical protein
VSFEDGSEFAQRVWHDVGSSEDLGKALDEGRGKYEVRKALTMISAAMAVRRRIDG